MDGVHDKFGGGKNAALVNDLHAFETSTIRL